jgi:hypothetical protein
VPAATVAGLSLPACIQQADADPAAGGYRFCQGKGSPATCADGSARGTCVIVKAGGLPEFSGDGAAGWVSGAREA